MVAYVRSLNFYLYQHIHVFIRIWTCCLPLLIATEMQLVLLLFGQKYLLKQTLLPLLVLVLLSFDAYVCHRSRSRCRSVLAK